MGTQQGAGSNPPAGGSNANTPTTNPLAGALSNTNPANGAPDGQKPANPQAGGQANDPNAPQDGPVSADVHREALRENQTLRKNWKETQERLQALEDAKLTETERDKKRLVDAEAAVAKERETSHGLRLQIAISDRVRERNLQDASVIKAILLTEFKEQLDDDPELTNVAHLIDLAVEKHQFLIRQPETPSPPGAGRQVSPPRSPQGQYAQRQPATPKPVEQWAKLGDYDWSKPGGNNS